jgi:hypothetical protein
LSLPCHYEPAISDKENSDMRTALRIRSLKRKDGSGSRPCGGVSLQISVETSPRLLEEGADLVGIRQDRAHKSQRRADGHGDVSSYSKDHG